LVPAGGHGLTEYLHQFYTDLLMQLHKQQPTQGYDALALQASERARARSLLELLTEARADIRTGVNPELVERERTVRHKLDAAEKRRLEASNRHSAWVFSFSGLFDVIKPHVRVPQQPKQMPMLCCQIEYHGP